MNKKGFIAEVFSLIIIVICVLYICYVVVTVANERTNFLEEECPKLNLEIAYSHGFASFCIEGDGVVKNKYTYQKEGEVEYLIGGE